MGIGRLLHLKRARAQWRKLNSHNGTTLGIRPFGLENVRVGRYTYGPINVLTSSANPSLRIGSFCSIAQEVTFVLHNEHALSRFSTYPFEALVLNEEGLPEMNRGGREGGCIVEDDVWLGYRSTILDGVRIGRGAVVAAGSVVTRDVPPYTVVGGVPARPIRKRFSDSVIDELLDFDFSVIDDAFIKNHRDALCAPLDIEEFRDSIFMKTGQ